MKNKNMKYIYLIVFILLTVLNANSQKLTLTDLQNTCNKTNWEYVNQYLMNKGWEYYDSEKGSSTKYNTITWSYNKSYSDKAEAWFYIYTYEGLPNKINYSVFNKSSYSRIQKSLSTLGYKLTENEIKDNEITSTYTSRKFILKITTEKRKKDTDYLYDEESITAYQFLLIKKSGIYDPNNGKKVDYWYDGDKIQAEYSLKNGKLNGKYTFYYHNGQIKKKGTYLNDLENGSFKEYYENGNLESEYSMKNGKFNNHFKTYYEAGKIKKAGIFKGKQDWYFKEYNENGVLEITYTKKNGELNGILTTYEDGKRKKEKEFQKGVLSGVFKEYHYNDKGSLVLIQEGRYLKEKENGLWQLFYIENGNKRLLNSTQYSNGIKSGNFQEVRGDSLIIGSYINNKKHGTYKVYFDLMRFFNGGFIRTDTTDLILTVKGNYNNGLKSNKWIYYNNLTGDLEQIGFYLQGNKSGIWSYYYPNITDLDNKPLHYSRELYLTENYKKNKKNGKAIRYSFLKKNQYPCDTVMNNEHLDTCTKTVYVKNYESFIYINDKLDGQCLIKDSTGLVTLEGTYRENKREGLFVIRFGGNPVITEKGNYKAGEKNGKWVDFWGDFLMSEEHYKGNMLNGERGFYNFNSPDLKKEIYIFRDDILSSYKKLDTLGNTKFLIEIQKKKNNGFKMKKTNYYSDSIVVFNYFIICDETAFNAKSNSFLEGNTIFDWFFLSKISNMSKGYKDGIYEAYNTNNQVIRTGKVYKKNKIGLWEYFYRKQKVRMEVEYENNLVKVERYYTLNTKILYKGDFIFFDKQKGIKEVRKIKNGLRNGKTKYYDSNGNKIKTVKYRGGKII